MIKCSLHRISIEKDVPMILWQFDGADVTCTKGKYVQLAVN